MDREMVWLLCGRRSVDSSAQLSACLCNSPAGRWRRPPRHSGTAGPRAALDHSEVHAGFAHGSDGGVRQGAPQGMSLRREFRPMLRLAVPLALAELGGMAMGVVDTIMAGPFGPAAVGAGILGNMLFYPI